METRHLRWVDSYGRGPNTPTIICFDHRQDPNVGEWRVLEGLGGRVTDVDELHVRKLVRSLVGLDRVLADRQPIESSLGFSEVPPRLETDAPTPAGNNAATCANSRPSVTRSPWNLPHTRPHSRLRRKLPRGGWGHFRSRHGTALASQRFGPRRREDPGCGCSRSVLASNWGRDHQ